MAKRPFEDDPIDIHKHFGRGKNRLNFVFMISHENFKDQPFFLDSRNSSFVETLEKPVPARDYVATVNKLVPLDLYWLKGQSGYIYIKNMAGLNLTTNPTPEQIAYIKSQVLIIHLKEGDDGLIVDPKMSQVIKPANVENVRIESKAGDIPFQVTIFPK